MWQGRLKDDLRPWVFSFRKESEMLVLSRKRGQTIVIEVPGLREKIRVSVVRIKGSVVRIGIEADPAAQIVRAELEGVDGSKSGSVESGA
jgi:carbon storage regulator CsrA